MSQFTYGSFKRRLLTHVVSERFDIKQFNSLNDRTNMALTGLETSLLENIIQLIEGRAGSLQYTCLNYFENPSDIVQTMGTDMLDILESFDNVTSNGDKNFIYNACVIMADWYMSKLAVPVYVVLSTDSLPSEALVVAYNKREIRASIYTVEI